MKLRTTALLIALPVGLAASSVLASLGKFDEASKSDGDDLQRRGFFSFHANPVMTHGSPFKMPQARSSAPLRAETGLTEKLLGSKTLEKLSRVSSQAASKAYEAVPQGFKASVARDAHMANGWLKTHAPSYVYKPASTAVRGITKVTNSVAKATTGEMHKQQTRRIVRNMAKQNLVPAESVQYVGRKTDRQAFLHALHSGTAYVGPVSREAANMPGVVYIPHGHYPPAHTVQYDPFGNAPGYAGWAAPPPTMPQRGASWGGKTHASQSPPEWERPSWESYAASSPWQKGRSSRPQSPPPGGSRARDGKQPMESPETSRARSSRHDHTDAVDYTRPPRYDDDIEPRVSH